MRRDLLAGASKRLTSMHESQVRREPWPDFVAFDVVAYPVAMRERSARQWVRRAREELGSVYEFSALTHTLCCVAPPVEVLGALSRLVTDEVRHAEMCARMAVAVWPEGQGDELFSWPAAKTPYDPAPRFDADDRQPTYRWAADVVLTSCCIGETISRPLFEAAATVSTDPVCEAVLRQILRDEHLHAAFGWEALSWLLDNLEESARGWLEARLASRLAGFERSSSAGLSLTDLAGTELVIERGTAPNLATLTRRQYAQIFYATLEAEVLPGFEAAGMDAVGAWTRRSRATGSVDLGDAAPDGAGEPA